MIICQPDWDWLQSACDRLPPPADMRVQRSEAECWKLQCYTWHHIIRTNKETKWRSVRPVECVHCVTKLSLKNPDFCRCANLTVTMVTAGQQLLCCWQKQMHEAVLRPFLQSWWRCKHTDTSDVLLIPNSPKFHRQQRNKASHRSWRITPSCFYRSTFGFSKQLQKKSVFLPCSTTPLVI